MIVVKVELHSAITGHVTELGKMIIANDGSQGNGSIGDYKVKLGRKGQKEDAEIWRKPQREGEVKGHRRLALSVWNLVAKALHSVGHGKEVESVEPRERILLNAVLCKSCQTVAVSKHRHDFRSCKCGGIAVDGGLDYLKRSGNLEDYEDLSIREEA